MRERVFEDASVGAASQHVRVGSESAVDGSVASGLVDRISQSPELQTPNDAGVGSINLPTFGLHISSFVKTATTTDASGAASTAQTTQAVRNVFLAGNSYYREYTDNPAVTSTAALLPQMRGSGQVRDLREAMSLGIGSQRRKTATCLKKHSKPKQASRCRFGVGALSIILKLGFISSKNCSFDNNQAFELTKSRVY